MTTFIRIFKMLVDLPFLPRFRYYGIDDETGHVYSMENEHLRSMSEYPLRTALAGYIMLLRMEGNKYLKEIK